MVCADSFKRSFPLDATLRLDSSDGSVALLLYVSLFILEREACLLAAAEEARAFPP